MNKKIFEQYVSELIPELYSYAYALVPDDLQAEQVVIDAYTVLSVHEKNLISAIIISSSANKLNHQHNGDKEKLLLKEKIYAYIYTVGAKRFTQLDGSFNGTLNTTFKSLHQNELKSDIKNDLKMGKLFFELTCDERSILFLYKNRIFDLAGMARV
ncbi:MAG: hypothetical protein HQK53_10750, partial [Oligoflexia bacterium]|nr:hypothetical protein [Oligoflexia bacterium]